MRIDRRDRANYVLDVGTATGLGTNGKAKELQKYAEALETSVMNPETRHKKDLRRFLGNFLSPGGKIRGRRVD